MLIMVGGAWRVPPTMMHREIGPINFGRDEQRAVLIFPHISPADDHFSPSFTTTTPAGMNTAP